MSVMLDRVVLRAAGVRGGIPWTLDLPGGTHALVITRADVARELSRVVAGIERAKRGRVVVGQEEPYRSPALRARLGVHFGRDFAGLEQSSGQDVLSRVRELRARHDVTMTEPLGLVDSARLARPLGELTPDERSDLELELALGLEKPALVWLSRPPRPRSVGASDEVLSRLRQLGADGVTVVVCVSTEREAQIWGDSQHPPGQSPSTERERTIQLVVERPREVAAELQREAAVLGTELDPKRPNLLLVHGTDDLALRRACGAAVLARRCELSEMVSVPSRRPASPAGGGA